MRHHNITPSCIHVNYTPAQFPQLIKFIFAKLELVPFEGESGVGTGGGGESTLIPSILYTVSNFKAISSAPVGASALRQIKIDTFTSAHPPPPPNYSFITEFSDYRKGQHHESSIDTCMLFLAKNR
jgi:hypothetical protein